MSKNKKPEGFEEFRKLLGPLSKVPKRELDSEVAKQKKRAKKRKK